MGDPDLYFAEDGTPRSARFGDIYYSPQDGLAESRAVFIDGCGLAERWRQGGAFTVLELGFGTGLNVAAAMDLWTGLGSPGHLHIFTIEAFVMSRDHAAQALANWPELADFAQVLMQQWPKARRGFHHMDFPQWRVSVTVALMPVDAALDAWDGQADSVFLDGFSPALNPDMWSQPVFARLARHSVPGAGLATFTVAGHVRRGLAAAGFSVAKCKGYGRKRERLEAVFEGEPVPARPLPRRIAIAGAGIAGACLAWQARQLGIASDIYDPEPGSGASGNVAALVTPRLDAGDNAISALFADAFAYATGLYPRLAPRAVIGQGVWQCAQNARDLGRFDRIAQQSGFAAGDVVGFSAGDLAPLPQAAGLHLTSALRIAPGRLIDALLDGQQVIRRPLPDDLSGYDAVVLACGDGIFDQPELAARLCLRPVRGQVESASGVTLDQAVTWGGYAVPHPEGLLFGATHERDDRGSDGRAASREANLALVAAVMPQVAQAVRPAELTSRASIRVATRDYLPVIGEIAPGLHVLTGLGSRGFCLAPLLAKAVLADITGHAPPLTQAARRLMRPQRFAPAPWG